MKKNAFNKKISLLLAVASTIAIFTTNVFAWWNYAIKLNLPKYNSYWYYFHETVPTSFKTPTINASYTWNNANVGMTLNNSVVTKTGGVTLGDSMSYIVYCDFTAVSWLPDGSGAACVALNNPYVGFDVFINSSITFGNGSSNNYQDRQGVMTHEFGHALGLADIYLAYGSQVGSVPTLYGTSYYKDINNVEYYNMAYYLRTLTQDDKEGIKAVVNLIK